jgi:hypothetical protein
LSLKATGFAPGDITDQQLDSLPPLEPAGKVVRKRPPQSVTAKDDAPEARTLHGRLQTATNGFDFG